MPVKSLEINSFLEKMPGCPVFDVRTPAEYEHGHIPGAVNLPLFSNEERVIVGTLYKNQGREKAILKGLELVGLKLKSFIQEAQPYAKSNEVLLYCWRGGMRSGSMAWLMDMYGYKVYTLKKGYKTYRNWALNEFSIPKQFIVLGGKTGSGKTDILHALKAKGESIIDLEALACHKGSAFGSINEPEPPTQEHFENMLALQLYNSPDDKHIWLEDESQSIGRKIIPNAFWEQMRSANVIFIDIPFEERVSRLVEGYGSFQQALLEESIYKVRKRLGDLACRQAVQALHDRRPDETARILLGYYDKAYMHGVGKREKDKLIIYSPRVYDIPAIADECIKLKDQMPNTSFSRA